MADYRIPQNWSQMSNKDLLTGQMNAQAPPEEDPAETLKKMQGTKPPVPQHLQTIQNGAQPPQTTTFNPSQNTNSGWKATRIDVGIPTYAAGSNTPMSFGEAEALRTGPGTAAQIGAAQANPLLWQQSLAEMQNSNARNSVAQQQLGIEQQNADTHRRQVELTSGPTNKISEASAAQALAEIQGGKPAETAWAKHNERMGQFSRSGAAAAAAGTVGQPQKPQVSVTAIDQIAGAKTTDDLINQLVANTETLRDPSNSQALGQRLVTDPRFGGRQAIMDAFAKAALHRRNVVGGDVSLGDYAPKTERGFINDTYSMVGKNGQAYGGLPVNQVRTGLGYLGTDQATLNKYKQQDIPAILEMMRVIDSAR